MSRKSSFSGARGERTIQVDGHDVTVLFTNRALAGAEKRLGKGIVAIAQGFADGVTGIYEVAALLHVGMEAYRVDSKSGGKPVSMDDAYDVLDQVGFAGIAGPVMEAVAEVIGYQQAGDEEDQDPN